MKASYDLHIHSCLSPCADDDMTPYNIVNMACLNGLDIIAVTDHNSVKNCRAVMAAAQESGIIAVPGMELTSAEDVHLLCLFETLEQAESFERHIFKDKLKIENKPHIFGNQIIYGLNDQVSGEEKYLLVPATAVYSHTAAQAVASFGGVCLPAHIDRPSNGILSILGAVEDWMGFKCVEATPHCPHSVRQRYGNYFTLTNSDAHSLHLISESVNHIELNELSARGLIAFLRGKGEHK